MVRVLCFASATSQGGHTASLLVSTSKLRPCMARASSTSHALSHAHRHHATKEGRRTARNPQVSLYIRVIYIWEYVCFGRRPHTAWAASRGLPTPQVLRELMIAMCHMNSPRRPSCFEGTLPGHLKRRLDPRQLQHPTLTSQRTGARRRRGGGSPPDWGEGEPAW